MNLWRSGSIPDHDESGAFVLTSRLLEVIPWRVCSDFTSSHGRPAKCPLRRQAMQLMPQVLSAGVVFGMLLETVGCGGSSGIRTDQSEKSHAGTGGGHSDGNGGETGEGGSTIDGSVIELGAACAPRGSLACAGRHQKLTLLCGASGVWEANGTCEPGEFCQAGAGVDQGTCLPEVEECRGEAPGAQVCLGDARRECGPDGVDSVLIE